MSQRKQLRNERRARQSLSQSGPGYQKLVSTMRSRGCGPEDLLTQAEVEQLLKVSAHRNSPG